MDEETNALSAAKRILKESEAELAEVKAELTLAEATFQRFKDLLERESVSLQEFDEVKTKYEIAKARAKKVEEAIASLAAREKQAEAALNEAKTYYEYTKIRAPFSGIITQKFVHEGDLATPGKTLLILEDPNHYQLEVAVNESLAKRITVGEETEIILDALSEKIIRGTVSELIPAIDPATRTFIVKIDLSKMPQIISGMYGKAYIPIGEMTVILVPRTAILENGQLTSIYVVNNHYRVEKRLITVGKNYGNQMEVLSGLAAGETVITGELSKIREGLLIQTRP